jgi:uncharacterized membrane protein
MNNQIEKDPKYWKGKTFYYNKDDKRLFVDKFYNNGTTLNLANKSSLLFLGGILVPPAIIVLVILLCVK